MLKEWSALVAPAAQERLCLLLNHVISRENVAMTRLKPHAGAVMVLGFAGWPALLPVAPDLTLQITPAGLLERLDSATGEPALHVTLDASNPAALALGAFSGAKPDVQVAGDAALAGDINWLVANLRWDIEDDLAGLVGPAAAHQLARFGQAMAAALAGLARQAGSFAR
ncbi:MAG TPA: hypothetical protein VGE47_13695 [Burkholderiaceae bacterium]